MNYDAFILNSACMYWRGAVQAITEADADMLAFCKRRCRECLSCVRSWREYLRIKERMGL